METVYLGFDDEGTEVSLSFIKAARSYYRATFRFCLYGPPVEAMATAIDTFLNEPVK